MILIKRLLSRLFGLFWLDFLVYLGYLRLLDHARLLRRLARSNSASRSLNKLKNLTRKVQKVSSWSLLINNIPFQIMYIAHQKQTTTLVRPSNLKQDALVFETLDMHWADMALFLQLPAQRYQCYIHFFDVCSRAHVEQG